MEQNYRASLTGVFGDPVDTNPTVVIQEAAFKDKGLNWRYLTLKVVPEDLEQAFKGMRAMNFSGINLTMPHKIEAMKYMDEIDKSAKLIGAINTVTLKDGVMKGYNTDGLGMVASIEDAGYSLKGKTVVVLGAGGAARAICVECALAGAKKIVIINRTAAKGEEIAEVINSKTDAEAEFIPLTPGIKIPDCDIIVNATNIGMAPDTNKPDIDYGSIKKGTVAVDVVFNPVMTGFLKEAEKQGAVALDGLGMLINQGAVGFELWTGEKADRAVMKAALTQALGL